VNWFIRRWLRAAPYLAVWSGVWLVTVTFIFERMG